jgi:hypothetical protein
VSLKAWKSLETVDLEQKLQTGKVAVRFDALFLGPTNQQQSGDGKWYVRHANFAPQQGSPGDRLRTEKANATFTHVLNSPQDRRLGFFFRFEREHFMGLNFQELRKSGMASAVRFQGSFHDE